MPKKMERKFVKQYIHDGQKRINNPPVGLVTAETDHLNGRTTYRFDPNLDPQLQWAGKAEGLSFNVDIVSLHVHDRIDPLTIIEQTRKRELQEQQSLFHYFETRENNPPIREAIEFYKHAQGWSNRLIAGDSLLVMNSLLEKEGLAGKVQMIYIDPPYGIEYGSNFQPFVNKKDVNDRKDEDLNQEPEMIKAFRDTWELGIHSYLTYLRNRVSLARDLLSESGSIFVQISDVNLHHVCELMDEIFDNKNRLAIIILQKTTSATTTNLATVCDFLLWYAKDKSNTKYRQLYRMKTLDEEGYAYNKLIGPKGEIRGVTTVDRTKGVPKGWELCKYDNLTSDSPGSRYPVEYKGRTYWPGGQSYWKTDEAGMSRLKAANRLASTETTLYYLRHWDDFAGIAYNNVWTDVARGGFGDPRIYVVQTNSKIIERCVLMTTDPGDLIFDPTCGSGTTAFVSEKWGRRWITCDTSRIAITIARQRLMTAVFPYFKLKVPKEGVDSGFDYEKIAHIMLGTVANQEPVEQETLYDSPIEDNSRVRVSGPFTVEAVPSQGARSFEEITKSSQADMSISRSGETLRQNEWISQMLSNGIRGKGGQVLEFVRIEPLGGTKWIHAEGYTKDGKATAISFGPEYAPLEPRQVELAIEEAQELVPKPTMVLFASFQFDPEAAKDLDDLKWPGVNVLKVQMNTDLLTSDLKKKGTSNEPFWLVGQPDVEMRKQGDKYVVEVNGFDYYNTKTGEIESGDVSKVAMWELDTDYDGRSVYPRQVFFPMAGKNEGWSRLARDLKAEIDEKLIEKFRGNASLPFKLGNNKQIAIKIVDDRGIESLKVLRVEEE
ncbi:MAG: site-specific DNA-methyltransferase [Candidatus Bathyarchaeia archaeon]